jgi:hypothetical protein
MLANRRVDSGTSVVFMSDAEAEDESRTTQAHGPGSAVRVIRGWKCGTLGDLHNEVGAALQFPSYYGENWDAMDECIRDLSWMPANSYLVVVLDIGSVLPDDEVGLRTFLTVLSDASKAWASPDPRFELPGRQATFRVVIAGDEAGISRSRAALSV